MSFYTNVFARKNKIYRRGYDKGLRDDKVEEYSPYLFTPAENGTYKTLDNKPVKKITFDSMWEAKEYLNNYKDVANKKIYGLSNFAYLYIYDNFPNTIKYDASIISVVSIDIETSLYSDKKIRKFPDLQEADHEITAITITKNGRSATFGGKDYKPTDNKQFYVKCENEHELIERFLQVWETDAWTPDIVTGWNIDGFDIPYLTNRILRIFSKKHVQRLSPWGIVEEKTILVKDREITYYSPMGIAFLDYKALDKKFTFIPREKYSLDFIASEELGMNKLDYSEFSDLEELYTNNYQKFIEYNIRDCFLVDKLEDKLKLIKMVINLAYTYKCNFEDTLGTVKPWDMYIHHYLMDRNIVIPQFEAKEADRELVGGYCKEVKGGLYKWTVSYDVKSSYPHQIMEYNISPETILGRLDDSTSIEDIIKYKLEPFRDTINTHDVSVAGNLCVFSKKKKGFMAEIMELMFAQRAEYQKTLKEYEDLKRKENTNKYDNLISEYNVWQQAKKISINAFYGMLANKWCRWNSIDLAEAITLSGQLTVKWIEHKINLYINKLCKTSDVDYICAGDTDSNYIVLEPLLKRFNIDTNDKAKCVYVIEQFCKEKLDPYIKQAFEELHEITNSYQKKIRMAREVIADVGIWTGKKHYMLNVLNKEGVTYDEPKLKMVGIETVKSSTPAVCRKALKDSITIIMQKSENELQNYVAKFKERFYTLTFDDVAFPRGVSDLTKYANSVTIYGKGTPIAVRGALVFNDLLKKYDLKNIQPIANGDKVKFSYLRITNHIRSSVISIPNFLPKEFKLERFIDYETQFEKAFLHPLMSITSVIGWQPEQLATVERFYDD